MGQAALVKSGSNEIKEPLINSEVPVAHGGATKINNYKLLILKEKRKSNFLLFVL